MKDILCCPLLANTTNARCGRKNCAWWCGDKCAVVLFALNTTKSTANIAESLELTKQSLKEQEKHSQQMAERWEELR